MTSGSTPAPGLARHGRGRRLTRLMGSRRHVSNIRTGTSTSLPDGSTSYNETPVVPSHDNLVGVVGGVGYKLFEYGKFKAMGEARYTRWFGYTFQGPAYESQKNQLEIGLSFTY